MSVELSDYILAFVTGWVLADIGTMFGDYRRTKRELRELDELREVRELLERVRQWNRLDEEERDSGQLLFPSMTKEEA